MTLKQLLITGGWSERHKRHLRPLWQIAVLLPLFAIYAPARAYVDWMDGL